MVASLVFQTGLLYEELRGAFLQHSYALVLTKDFKKVIWASTKAAEIKWNTVFEAIKSEIDFEDFELAQLQDALQSGNSCTINSLDIEIFVKPFFDFSKLVTKDCELTIEELNKLIEKDAVLLIEETFTKLKLSNLLVGLESKKFATAIISSEGSITSLVRYADKRLFRNVYEGISIEYVNFIAEIFLKLKNLIYINHNPIKAAASSLEYEKEDNFFYNFTHHSVKYKILQKDNVSFLVSVLSFYLANNIEYFLVVIEINFDSTSLSTNEMIDEDSEAFNKIAEFLRSNSKS